MAAQRRRRGRKTQKIPIPLSSRCRRRRTFTRALGQGRRSPPPVNQRRNHMRRDAFSTPLPFYYADEKDGTTPAARGFTFVGRVYWKDRKRGVYSLNVEKSKMEL